MCWHNGLPVTGCRERQTLSGPWHKVEGKKTKATWAKENVDGACMRDERGLCQAAAWAAAMFLNSYFSRLCDFFRRNWSGIFGVFFRCIFWGGFGGRFGVRCIFLTYFLNLHNINDSSSSTVNATFELMSHAWWLRSNWSRFCSNWSRSNWSTGPGLTDPDLKSWEIWAQRWKVERSKICGLQLQQQQHVSPRGN